MAARTGKRTRLLREYTKLLIYGLFQKGRVLAQDGVAWQSTRRCLTFSNIFVCTPTSLLHAMASCAET